MVKIQHCNISGDINKHTPKTHGSSHTSTDPIGVATASANGFLLALDSDPTHYMNGQGAWTTPLGGGGGTSTWEGLTDTVAAIVANELVIGNGAGDQLGFVNPNALDVDKVDGCDAGVAAGDVFEIPTLSGHGSECVKVNAGGTALVIGACGTGGTSDHGALTGLADDDHTQYLLASGVRAMTGDLNMANHYITNANAIRGGTLSNGMHIVGGSVYGAAQIGVMSQYSTSNPGNINFFVSNTLTTLVAVGGFVSVLNGGPYLAMNSHRIRGLGAGIAATDAATVEQANTRHIQVEIFPPADDVTVGAKRAMVHLPFAGTLTRVHAEVDTASSSGLPTVDINKNGSTVLSTKLTIDVGETGSDEATIPAAISDGGIAENDVYTFDVDGGGTGTKGLVVTCTVVVT